MRSLEALCDWHLLLTELAVTNSYYWPASQDVKLRGVVLAVHGHGLYLLHEFLRGQVGGNASAISLHQTPFIVVSPWLLHAKLVQYSFGHALLTLGVAFPNLAVWCSSNGTTTFLQWPLLCWQPL